MAASKPNQKVAKAIAPLRVSVKFLTDCDPGNGKPTFKAGSVRELVISSANHWVRRGKAVKYVEPVKKAGRSKKVDVKLPRRTGRARKIEVEAKPGVEESGVEESASEETPEEKPEEPAEEGKKTEDGESFGVIPNLLD